MMYWLLADPLSFTAVCFVSGTIALPPGAFLNIAAGAQYGILFGSFLFQIGFTAGGIFSMLIVRYLVPTFAMRALPSCSEERRLALDAGIENQGGWLFVSLTRVSAVMPFNLANAALALTRVAVVPYTIGTAIGLLPLTAAYSYLGKVGQQAYAGGWHEYPVQLLLSSLGLLATFVASIFLGRLGAFYFEMATAEEAELISPDQSRSDQSESREAEAAEAAEAEAAEAQAAEAGGAAAEQAMAEGADAAEGKKDK